MHKIGFIFVGQIIQIFVTRMYLLAVMRDNFVFLIHKAFRYTHQSRTLIYIIFQEFRSHVMNV